MQTQQERVVQAQPGEPEEAVRRPVWPSPPSEPPADAKDALTALRRFHHGDPDAGRGLEAPGSDWLPVLLYPYRDAGRIRNDYPLFLFPPAQAEPERLCLAVSDLLKQCVESFAPGAEDARVLKDNLPRLERLLREDLADTPVPVPAAPHLAEAGRRMQEELSLRPAAAGQLREDLTRLLEAVPEEGRLLALTEAAGLHLFLHAAACHLHARHAELRKELTALRAALRDLLRIERAKQIDPEHPEALRASLGGAGAEQLDATELARVLEHARNVPTFDEARRQRVTHVLDVIDRFLNSDSPARVTVVHADSVAESCKSPDAQWQRARLDGVCRTACEVFDRQAAAYAELFAAVRIARLEIQGAYDASRHDRLLESFDWRAFAREELQCLPPVLAVESASHLAGSGMADLSRLLLSGRPVAVLVAVQPAADPGREPQADPLGRYRFELGYLGIAHREALVQQSSAARPEHLVKGFEAALTATHASLHVVASGLTAEGRTPRLGAWLHAGAALEGRAHPFFHYNPEAGATWARRFDFVGNPAPEDDWPVYDLTCQNVDGQEVQRSLAFTFADFALLEEGYREHFRVVPDAVAPDDEFVPLHEYLAGDEASGRGRIPFIWAADARGRVHRVVVSRALALACGDRLHYWRTLQELAGIRNEHVREAVQRERERLEREFAAERERLQVGHAQEVERVRSQAASEAMQRLAQALLETDLGSLPATGATGGGATGGATAGPSAEAPMQVGSQGAPAAGAEQVEEEEEEPVAQEPWITSALCTSCNDCININPQMFKYNANKQAVIADPRAGTYAQLVQAAEKCPARCIHPGLPLNPDEPNLEALIERAKPFN